MKRQQGLDRDPVRESLVSALDRMLGSEGWQVAATALTQQLEKARRQYERVTPTDVVAITGLQERIKLLKLLLEDPRKFLKPENGKQETVT